VTAYEQGICLGIITTLMTFSDRLPPAYRFCVSPKATPDEAIHAALAFLEGNPSRLKEQFVKLATEALHDAWPCQ
jgi:Rap1a immunity proteins